MQVLRPEARQDTDLGGRSIAKPRARKREASNAFQITTSGHLPGTRLFPSSCGRFSGAHLGRGHKAERGPLPPRRAPCGFSGPRWRALSRGPLPREVVHRDLWKGPTKKKQCLPRLSARDFGDGRVRPNVAHALAC